MCSIDKIKWMWISSAHVDSLIAIEIKYFKKSSRYICKVGMKKKRDENEKIAENLNLNAFACLSTPVFSIRQFGQFAGKTMSQCQSNKAWFLNGIVSSYSQEELLSFFYNCRWHFKLLFFFIQHKWNFIKGSTKSQAVTVV